MRKGTKVGRVPKLERDTNSPDIQAATGNLERDFLQLTPGGSIEIDAKSVVASATAEPHEIRSQEAGLIQLMQSGGALTQNQSGKFLILRQIGFLPPLWGVCKVSLDARRTMPGNSLIVSEDTGEAIGKPR